MGYNNFDKGLDNANSYGSDNINRDPQFVLDGSDDQYALSDASFLIGAGIKTFESRTAPTKDILGNPRPSGSSTITQIWVPMRMPWQKQLILIRLQV